MVYNVYGDSRFIPDISTAVVKPCSNLHENVFTCAPVTPILAQKLLTASGGNPLRLRAVKVKSRGSSQSRQIPG